MTSSLTWIDHDARAAERVNESLASFHQKESRDELGLGVIRDSLADRLFPGTSTLHTRLKYVLLIPWMYQRLEKNFAHKLVKKNQDIAKLTRALIDDADIQERDVAKALKQTCGDGTSGERGIIGSNNPATLKNLPSSMYWSCLRDWGIYTGSGSRGSYHRNILEILLKRQKSVDADENNDLMTWHPSLPEAPDGEPTLLLSRDEATFVQERIALKCKGSLLAHLAQHSEIDIGAKYPWQLVMTEHETSRELLDLLHHAKRFSIAMHGAALMYNHELARVLDNHELVRGLDKKELIERYAEQWRQWLDEQETIRVQGWDLAAFWKQIEVIKPGHPVRFFVEHWVKSMPKFDQSTLDDQEVIGFIINREKAVKKHAARFANEHARKQWQGASGVGRMTYRWPNVKQLLLDLRAGLASNKGGFGAQSQ